MDNCFQVVHSDLDVEDKLMALTHFEITIYSKSWFLEVSGMTVDPV